MAQGDQNCFFCGADECVVPEIGITWGMYGVNYAFCESCLSGMSAHEMWRQLFLSQGIPWPPRLKPKPPPMPAVPPSNRYGRSPKRKRSASQRERQKMSNGLRYKVMRRDGFHCQICGKTGKEAVLVVDHVEPVARGGKTEMENLRTLCRDCNSGKGTKRDGEA